MEMKISISSVAELRTVLRAHPALRLEFLSGLSKLLREHHVEIDPNLLGRITLMDETGEAHTARRTRTGASSGPAPVTAGPAPVTAGPAPVTAGPAPMTAGPAPVTAGPAPVMAGPAPVAAGPAPVAAGPAPVMAGPAPGMEEEVLV